jgi:hypothetical protein
MATNQARGRDSICEAIRRHTLLEFRYHGLHRVVEPYCYGISTRGAEVLRAVQIGGSSSSGGFGFGKLWLIEDIVDLQMTDKPFKPDDPNYNPNDSGMTQVLCRV